MVSFTIIGEPQSKANSRRLVINKKTGKPMFIKSEKAIAYVKAVKDQVRPLPKLLEGPLAAWIGIYYASRRPDLDESLILDALQGLIYKNDRQIHYKHVCRWLDRENPRAQVRIYEIEEPAVNFAHAPHARGRAA